MRIKLQSIKTKWNSIWGLAGLVLLLVACEPGPQEIRIGEQECDHCRMMISDEHFASQMVTQQGRNYAFDAIECMAAYVESEEGQRHDIHSLWVPDFDNPEEWLPADEAVYLQSEELHSPMALNLSAYATERAAKRQQSRVSGKVIDWNEVRSLVHEAWSNGHQH